VQPRREDEAFAEEVRPILKRLNQLKGDRDFALLAPLRKESEMRLRGHPDCPQLEIDVSPKEEYNLLLSKACQQECREQFPISGDGKELLQFGVVLA